MTIDRTTEYLTSLIQELRNLPEETEWVEFKENNSNPQEIGEYISALANASALNGKANGYLLWGIKDGSHDIVGTTFSPSSAKKGNEPMVEIFDDRIEITNPGEPLVDTQRFVDTPPKSRNEVLASLMRRFRIREERGSGIDKVVFQVELFQLPAPLFEAPDGFTRTVLFAHRSLTKMDKADQIRACYLHACLKYVVRDFLTNTSLRERFGIAEHNRSIASRMIRDALDAEAIAPIDPSAAPKMRKYVPWWAAPEGKETGTT